MSIKGKKIVLNDDNNNPIFPVSSSDIIRRPSSNKTVEETLKMKVGYKDKTDESIEVNYPGIRGEVDRLKKENEELRAELGRIDSELETNANDVSILKDKIVYLNEFYVDDFTLALHQAISQENVAKVVIDGIYNVKTGVVFENINNLTIEGNCSLFFNNTIDSFLEFKNSKNIKISGMKIDCFMYENYKTIYFNNCNNVNINDIEIKNIKNMDYNRALFNIFLYSSNYSVQNIRFENITQRFLKEYETTGKGSVQNIYCLIDDTHSYGVIRDIYSKNCNNFDMSNNILMGDYDIIKTQYNGGLNEQSATTVKSNLIIDNVKGYNFGKRLVKLQTSWVDVYNLSGYTETGDSYSCIGIHCGNINLKNVYFESINTSARCILEIGYFSDNIFVENVTFNGELSESAISIAGRYIDGENYECKNITLNNIIFNGISNNFIQLLSDVSSLNFTNMSVNGIFNKNFLIKYKQSKVMKNVVISNSTLECISNVMFDCNTELQYIDMSINNVNITHKRLNSTGDRHTFISPSNYGLLEFNNVNFSTDSDYKWGYMYLVGLDEFILNNVRFINCNGNSAFECSSRKASITNCEVDDGDMKCNTKDLLLVKGLIAKVLYCDSLDSNYPTDVVLNGFTGEFSQATNKPLNVLQSDIIMHKSKVSIVNGIAELVVNFPTRQTTIKIINAYCEGNNEYIKIIPKLVGSWYSLTFTIIDTSNATRDVDIVVLYSR